MSVSSQITKVLSDFGKNTVLDLDKSLMSKVSKGGGYNPRLRALIKWKFTPAKDKIVMAISMPEYGLAVDGGRRPTEKNGTGELKKNLISWIKRKGLKIDISENKKNKAKTLKNKKVRKAYKQITRDKKIEQVAFLIARKIHKDGYKGNHFFSEVIKDGRIEELKNELSTIIKTEIIINIRDGIND